MGKGKTTKKVIIGVVLIFVITSVALFYHLGDSDGAAATYRLAKIERGSIVSTVSATGTLNAVVTVQVGSQVSGQIKEILADFNSEVKKDQVIAHIDPENFEARVRQAEAELAVAKANVVIQRAAVERSKAELQNSRAALDASKAQTEKARIAMAESRRDLGRKEALRKQSIISESQLDEARAVYEQAVAQLSAIGAQEKAQVSHILSKQAELKMAEAQVEYALAQVTYREAALQNSKVDLQHTVIRSPVDGVIIERSVDIGQTVAASLQAPTLFTIAQDLRKMQVDTSMDEADIGRVQSGLRTTFTVDAFPGREFTGRVEQIRKAPKTVQNVVTYTVVVSAENEDLRLLPGMTANVQIIVDERTDALKMPNAALRFQPSGSDAGQAKAPEGGSPGGPGAGPGGGRPPQGAGNLERLAKDLQLNEAQQTQIQDVFSGIRQQAMAMRQQGASQEEMRAELKRLRDQNQSVILAILTPEQREKYRGMMAERAANPVTRGRVWFLGADGKPLPVEIFTGISDGAFTEIVRGDIPAGKEVIIGANQQKASKTPARTGGPRLGF